VLHGAADLEAYMVGPSAQHFTKTASSSPPRWARGTIDSVSLRSPSSFEQARAAGRRAIARSHAPHAYALLCARGVGSVAMVALVTSDVEVFLKDRAASLLVCLAGARRDADGLPKWSSVGDVLLHLGAVSPTRIDRHGLRALIRYLQRCVERCNIPTLVQTHRSRGVRLTTFPAVVVWWSAARG
jgi:hypothetical protein